MTAITSPCGPQPAVVKATEGPFAMYEAKGVEDARITQFGDTYYIFYSAFSGYGMRIGLMQTDDFEEFERLALDHHHRLSQQRLVPREDRRAVRALRAPRTSARGARGFPTRRISIYWGDAKLLATPCGENGVG